MRDSRKDSMTSFEVRDKTDEEVTAHGSVRSNDRYSFLYNGDLSGNVTILHDVEIPRDDPRRREGVVWVVNQTFIIPAHMLLDFIGEHIGREIVSNIMSMPGRDVLRRLVP